MVMTTVHSEIYVDTTRIPKEKEIPIPEIPVEIGERIHLAKLAGLHRKADREYNQYVQPRILESRLKRVIEQIGLVQMTIVDYIIWQTYLLVSYQTENGHESYLWRLSPDEEILHNQCHPLLRTGTFSWAKNLNEVPVEICSLIPVLYPFFDSLEIRNSDGNQDCCLFGWIGKKTFLLARWWSWDTKISFEEIRDVIIPTCLKVYKARQKWFFGKRMCEALLKKADTDFPHLWSPIYLICRDRIYGKY